MTSSQTKNIHRPSFLLPVISLWRREVVRFLRQRSRIIGALGTPVVFWVLIGSGLGRSFRPSSSGAGEAVHQGSMDYLEYFFPGTMVLIVLFTAIFSTISIIEDRREGFMQSVIAAPVRRSAIVLGKVLGSSTLALIQAMLFMLLAPISGIPLTLVSAISVFLVLIPVAIGLSGLGFLIAWPMESTQGFHAIMNLFLMPMWLLSGAFFPAEGASTWLGWVMKINPLTYGVTSVRHALYSGSPLSGGGWLSIEGSLWITIIFAVVTILLSAKVVSRKPS